MRSEVKEILFRYQYSPYLSKEKFVFKDAKNLIENGNNLNKRFPGYRFSVVEYDLKQTLLSNGHRKTSGHICYRLNSISSLKGNRVSLEFDEARSNIKILGARVILPDASVVLLSDDDIFTSISSDKKSIDRYVKLNLIFPGVCIGSLIDYTYEKYEHTPFNKEFFFPKHSFYDRFPTGSHSFSIEVPKNAFFKYSTRNFKSNPDPLISNNDNSISYTWTLHDLIPIEFEPESPPYYDTLPFVYATTVDSWDRVFKWYAKFLNKRLETTPKIIEQARLITASGLTEEDKVNLLYIFMQRNVRYISLKESISSSFSGHSAENTLSNGYGDCIDKSILFSALLKVIGIKSNPIILMTNDQRKQIDDIPCLDGNHAIVKCYINDKEYYLDPSSIHYNFPYFDYINYGSNSMDIMEGKLSRIPVPDPKDNSFLQQGTISILSPQTARLEIKTIANGSTAAKLRNLYSPRKNSEIEEIFEGELSKRYPGSNLNNIDFKHLYDLKGNLEIKQEYILYNLGAINDKFFAFNLEEIIPEFTALKYKNRMNPLFFQDTKYSSNSFCYNLPSNMRIIYIPASIKIENPFFSYSGSYSINGKDIVFKDEYIRKSRLIPVEKFNEFKLKLFEIITFTREQIILEFEE